MDRNIYHNNRIIDEAEARVPPATAGLLYGWGVFTTLRIYDGKVFAFGRHWERLTQHAGQTELALPMTLEQARAALDHLLTANAVRNGRARITLLKGDAGAWRLPPGPQSELLMFTAAEARKTPPEA